MRSLSIKSARLTSEGAGKIDRFAELAEKSLVALLEDSSEDIKERIASFAPTEEDEALQLCYPGIPRDNFLKEEEGFMYVRQAIKAENIFVRSVHGVLKTEFGNVQEISPRVGFAWFHGRKGEATTRTTLTGGELWKTLLAYWEYGGTLVVITPRDPGDTSTYYSAIEGRRVTVTETEKQIPAHPYEMYQLGGFYAETLLLARIKARLKEVATWL